jgi:acyl-CoA thioesterase FadM
VSDDLKFVLVVQEVGRSSLQLTIDAWRADKRCYQMSSTLVLVGSGENGRYGPLPFPDDMKARLLKYAEPA